MRAWLAGMIAVWGSLSPNGSAEQRHHRVPVGERADDRRLGEGGDVGHARVPALERLRADVDQRAKDDEPVAHAFCRASARSGAASVAVGFVAGASATVPGISLR